MTPGSPGHFRVLIALNRLVIYDLAPEVRVHPARLGQMIAGKVAMPAVVAERLSAAIARRAQPELAAG